MDFNKIILRLASVFALLGAFAFTGCGNVLEGRADETEYGSLVIGGASSSDCSDFSSSNPMRALSVESVKTAVATVSGYGMTSVSSEKTSVSGGKGSVLVSKIPVGRNRIVTVQGYSDSGAASAVSGAVLRAVVDINSGLNTLSEISWTTSRKGYVYNALLEDGVDISSFTDSVMKTIGKAIPEVDATNINLPLFVSDFAKGSGTLQDSSAYILESGKTLKRLAVAESQGSSESSPAFTATAYYSDGTNADVTSNVAWTSSDESVATVSGGKVTLKASGTAVVSAAYTYGDVSKTGAKQTITVKASGGTIDKLYFTTSGTNWSQASPRYAAYFFVGDTNEWVDMTLDSTTGYYVCSKPSTSYTTVIFCRMNPSTAENSWASKWNQTADLTIPSDSDTYKYDDSTWDKGSGEWLSVLSGSYSGGTLSATIDSEVVSDPLPPTVTIAPSSGTVSTSGTITVSYAENNAAVTSASVTLSGAVSRTYSLSDFSGGKLSIKVSDLGITEADKTINVSASATNSEGNYTATASLTTVQKVAVADTFTWDNANVYFVIQDRFYDGDSSNNNSYGRMSTDDLGKTIGTFHGGDIKGLTEKLDYLDKLGVNAIWITAPYEQAHGWCGGGSSGDFAHYAYHGYYPLDYTMMDKNMGTVEEFRTFVTESHKRGIRVVMDVVMNHTGYLTLQDCQDYSLDIFTGSFSGGKSTDMGFKIGSDGSTYHSHHDKIDYSGHNDGWAKWWGSSWVRAGVPGYTAGGGDDLTGCLSNLPDVKTESTAAQTVAPILQTKWSKETSGYDSWIVPAAKSLRSTSATNAPVVWIEKWLAAWVEEFGIDGFRCDTAKHVDQYRWGELKNLCKTALADWRNSSRADEYAKDWDEDFWMTGECNPWNYGGDSSWFSNGFDTMIDFSVCSGSGKGTYSPTLPEWENRTSNRKGLLYISSHDTGLGRWSDQKSLGTKFVLMPGPIQIYYGDETSRSFGDTGSDSDQGTRSDFNWSASTGETAVHWGKVGTFRKYNPAVGAGSISGNTRTYGDNQVVISITSGTVSVPYSDGTTVYNWYDGTSATVSGGSVSFSGGSQSQPVLVSDRNPSDYGVTF